MRNKFVWSFFGLVALATGALVSGCDSDEKIVKSRLNESCEKTSDCEGSLRCIEGTCYKATSGSSGSSNMGDGGSGEVTGPTPPVLGSDGESCSKRADCADGLGCFSGRCQKPTTSTGEGGEGNVPSGPTLGGEGETCGLTSDCATGLQCLPQDDSQIFADAKAIGSNSVGVCTRTDNGLTPTGNACMGAECKEAADCYELPVATHVAYSVLAPYGVAANSCAELEDIIAKSTGCATAVLPQLKVQCFAYDTYCKGTKGVWSCTAAGACQYDTKCDPTTPAASTGGCPAFTRTGSPVAACSGAAGKCQAIATCKADADCDPAGAVAPTTADTLEACAVGECTCYKATSSCYRKCNKDLDCAVGYSCDTKLAVCTKSKECASDAACVTKYNNIDYKCSADGACQLACENDLDCNSGRLTRGSATMICNAKKACEAVGCETDDQCGAKGGVKTFCTKVPEAATGAVVTSAVTD